MSASAPLTHFGRIYPPDEAWLAKQPPEPILDPDLPIIDPHHHLWDRPNHRYLLDEFLADVRTGHKPIIMCHAGGPLGYGPYAGKRDEVFATWKTKITELATCPNVVIKLGGMINRLAAYWRPYMETCIERFGPDRCMFESNFPVEKMGISWAALWNAFKRIAAGVPAEEKLALFSG